MVRADGTRARLPASVFSARRRRVAHSRTTLMLPWKPLVRSERQRADALSEHVAALTTDDPPDSHAVMPRPPHDLFDRDAVLPECENGCIRLLSPQIAFIL
jgi:hypothetical protein